MAQYAASILNVLKAILFAYLATGIILLILALLLLNTDISFGLLRAGVIFSYLFSALVAGFAAGKKASNRRFLWGMAAGFFYFAILFAISFVMGGMLVVDPGTMGMIFVMCTLGGMFGGMFS